VAAPSIVAALACFLTSNSQFCYCLKKSLLMFIGTVFIVSPCTNHSICLGLSLFSDTNVIQ